MKYDTSKKMFDQDLNIEDIFYIHSESEIHSSDFSNVKSDLNAPTRQYHMSSVIIVLIAIILILIILKFILFFTDYCILSGKMVSLSLSVL